MKEEPISRLPLKTYNIEYKIPFKPFIDESLRVWPEYYPDQEPDETILLDFCYKLANRESEKIFDIFKEEIRPFQDSSIEVQFQDFIPMDDEPLEALYDITIKIMPEWANKNRNITKQNLEQTKKNEEFTENRIKLEKFFRIKNWI